MATPDERFAALRQQFECWADGHYGSGCSAEQVAEVERLLGVTLPESYRRFLRQFGWAPWPDYLAGVSRFPPADVVRLTQDERTEVEPPMRWSLVPIRGDGYGNHYCLDTSKLVDGEFPVVVWNHQRGLRQRTPVVAASYLDWLEELVAQHVEWEREEERQGNPGS